MTTTTGRKQSRAEQQSIKRIKVQKHKNETFFYIRLKFETRVKYVKKKAEETVPLKLTHKSNAVRHSTCPRRSLLPPRTTRRSPPPNENSAVSGTRKWRKARSSKVKVRRSTLEILALALAPAQPNKPPKAAPKNEKNKRKICQLAQKTRTNQNSN